MAFTQSWVESDPPVGTTTVSQLDNYQRDAKFQIRERLEGDPANLGSGVFESSGGGFASVAEVKKGVARAFTITNADQTTTKLQDGRLAVNLDTNVLYHSRGSGLVAIAVLGSGIVAPILVADGSVGAPAYSFTSDTNTGMYRSGADSLSLVSGGVANLHVTGGASWVNALHFPLAAGPHFALSPSGSGGLQLKRYAAAADSKFYFLDNASVVQASIDLDNGAASFNSVVIGRGLTTTGEAFRVGNDASLWDVDTANRANLRGMQDPVQGELTFGSGGTFVVGVQGGSPIVLASSTMTIGTTAAVGIFLRTNGTDKWNVVSAGHLLAVADNAYDIGAAGATRPRNLYVANDIFCADAHLADVLDVGDGTELLPSITFGADTNTGLYRRGIDQIAIATAGVGRWYVDESGRLLAEDDASYDIGASGGGRPRDLFLQRDLNVVRDTILGSSLTVGLSVTLTNGPLRNHAGTEAAPAYSFHGDTNTGIYNVIDDFLAIVCGGLTIATFFEAAGVGALQVTNTGIATTPSYGFSGSTSTGMFNPSGTSGRLGFSAGGTQVAEFDDNATADNMSMLLYDISAAALKRVSRGASDSGGSGFRVLRVPN